MIVYLFMPTGEIRPPKVNEWYMLDDGAFNYWHDWYANNSPFPIFTRHEIEVPETTEFITVIPFNGPGDNTKSTYIEIKKPKPKVKKWMWAISYIDTNNYNTTVGKFTEKEVTTHYPERKWYHKIDETMVGEE